MQMRLSSDVPDGLSGGRRGVQQPSASGARGNPSAATGHWPDAASPVSALSFFHGAHAIKRNRSHPVHGRVGTNTQQQAPACAAQVNPLICRASTGDSHCATGASQHDDAQLDDARGVAVTAVSQDPAHESRHSVMHTTRHGGDDAAIKVSNRIVSIRVIKRPSDRSTGKQGSALRCR